MQDIQSQQQRASDWFRTLRDQICATFETLENELTGTYRERQPGRFERKAWQREEGGGGEMSVMRGRVFEKVGVNISTVHGEFSETMRKEIPGADTKPCFWASGISLVAHMQSPLVPAVHMNTRMIVLSSCRLPVAGRREEALATKHWFGGGADLTPMFPDEADTQEFHAAFKRACDAASPEYYATYKKWCDEYFYLKHRGEPRGVGGIFCDNINTGNFDEDFSFIRAIGETLHNVYPRIVRHHMNSAWTQAQREHQLIKRGRYVEFNLLYDRGTRFGIMTNGNPEAILMSLPPEVKWP